ncbi:MAG: pentapeptide repeat-containing protein [Verrucomicrobiaceae bacterium]|nr:pentapeptide repeat-containing protein [Verrucomicrobiaceae bacterium]
MKKSSRKLPATKTLVPVVRYSGSDIAAAADKIAKPLGGADTARLHLIAPLFVEGQANLAACAACAFPEIMDASALTAAFNKFRSRVNAAAKRAKFALNFGASAKSRFAGKRTCWITGPQQSVAPAMVRQLIQSRVPVPDREPSATTMNPAIDVSGDALLKPAFGWATIHATSPRELKLAEELAAMLDTELRACATLQFHRVVDDRSSQAHIILPLLSPGFCADSGKVGFADSFVERESGRIVMPVLLQALDESQKKSCGLIGQLQPFGLVPGEDAVFSERTTRPQKEAFAHKLYEQIVANATEALRTGRATPVRVHPPKSTAGKSGGRARVDDDESDDLHQHRLDRLALTMNTRVALGERFDAAKKGENPARVMNMGELLSTEITDIAPQGDAVDLLMHWLHDPKAPAFCAVLGEYGIGKTTSLRRLADRLTKEHARHPARPQAFFIDLREYVDFPDDASPDARAAARGRVQTLHSIMERAIHLNWREADGPKLRPDDILRAVRTQGAVLIFDGLDERVVHMEAAAAHAFIRELWSALPDPITDASGKLPAGHRRGRLIISCRSHYFRTVTQQIGFFSGNFREGITAEDLALPRRDRDRAAGLREFRAVLVLPYGEAEIRAYLAKVAGMNAERTQHALDVMHGIHNLTELARRPVLLSFIAAMIGRLETLQMAGRSINAAALYGQMAEQWLARDEPKHRLKPDHKLEIMEYFAAALWRSGSKEWSAKEAENWLAAAIDQHLPHIRSRIDRDGVRDEIVEHDFRAATFIVGTGKDRFRFAHTSFQEYFLACHLVHALRSDADKALDAWDLPQPSVETFEFIGQLLTTEPAEQQQDRLYALEDILGTPSAEPRAATTRRRVASRPRGHLARLNVFRYWMLAREQGLPEPQPPHVNLAGADLEDLRLEAPPGPPVNLHGASLRAARLNRAHLTNLDLRGADLSGAELRQAVVQDVIADEACLDDADLDGLQWRGGSLRGAKVRTARLHADWVRVDLEGTTLPTDWARQACASGGAGAHAPEADERTAQFFASIGHGELVTACAWSPDGQQVLSGSDDNTLKLWDARSGQCRLTLQGHKDSVSACAWSPDGEQVLSGSDDHTLKLWDARSGQCRLTLQGHEGSMYACAWSPDSQQVLSGSYDHTLKLWDARSGQCRLTLQGHTNTVSACAWSPDGQQVLSGSNDNTLKLWDARSGQCRLTLQGHKDSVSACAWSPDSQQVLSGSDDNTLKLWDARSGQCRLTLQGHKDSVSACAWSPDGQQVLSGSFDNTLKLWDARSGQCRLTLQGHTIGVYACAWSPDGQQVLSGSSDHTLKLWDARSGQCRLTLQGHTNGVSACAWSPDGQQVLSGSDDDTLKLWDARSGQCRLTLQGDTNGVSACAWSPDSQQVLSGSYDHTLKLWDAHSGQCRLTLQGHTNTVYACAWSPDGEQVLSGSFDNTLKLWDARSGQCRLTLQGHKGSVYACAWSPDGQQVLSGSWDGTLKLWDARSGQCRLTLQGHTNTVRACAWSPDGQQVLSGSWDGTLKLWDARSGQCRLTLQGHTNGVSACAWSPDGQQVLSGSNDNTVKLWDPRSGQCRLTLQGHTNEVTACAWSPDGQQVLSGSDDDTLKLWDARSGQCLWTGLLLPEAQAATFRTDHLPERGTTQPATFQRGDLLAWTPEAWRFLRWRRTAPAANSSRLLPAEHFGPLTKES